MPRTLFSIADLLERLLTPIAKKMYTISVVACGIMALPIFFDILSRLITGKALPGVIEIEETLMVIIVFFSLAYTQMKKEHVVVEFLFLKLPARIRPYFSVFNLFVCSILFGLISWQMILQVVKKWSEISLEFHIPLSIFYSFAAIGVIFITLVLILDFIRSISTALKEDLWSWLILSLGLGVIVLLLPILIRMLPWDPSKLLLGGLGMLMLMIFIAFGMPIGFAMALIGLLGLATIQFKMSSAFHFLAIGPYDTTASFILAVAPLFVLMGMLSSRSGLSEDLYDSAYKWLGRLPGGLSMSAITGCAGFAAVCGDSLATAITMGSVALPEMEKKKYNPSLACGSLAAGGTLGILIPPSLGFIFYAIITEESVGHLFIAGIIPGILLTILFIFTIFIIAIIKPDLAPVGERTSLLDKILSLKKIVGMLALFVLILGGILGGFFSPTEGGAIGAIGAFVFALLKKRMTWKMLVQSCNETVIIACKILTILMGVAILNSFLAVTQLPSALAETIFSLGTNRYIIFSATIFIFIILGCVMNVIPMLMITLPAIFPTIVKLGFDPIWFGVVTVIVMEMGQITPPIGINVFALKSVARDVPLETIFKGVFPFFICMVVTVFILTIWPQLAIWLPNLFFG